MPADVQSSALLDVSGFSSNSGSCDPQHMPSPLCNSHLLFFLAYLELELLCLKIYHLISQYGNKSSLKIPAMDFFFFFFVAWAQTWEEYWFISQERQLLIWNQKLDRGWGRGHRESLWGRETESVTVLGPHSHWRQWYGYSIMDPSPRVTVVGRNGAHPEQSFLGRRREGEVQSWSLPTLVFPAHSLRLDL